ncbi:hypothetical protein BDP27DRAFT_1403630 [Rhodocollybia butyracea]|uniref:Uncharacterized protein n=1 Tax=Rhodocollybia butyracea TaxID=206335 RepID=A0A9P5U6M1_9AGAR|nr:hypothetical protein BDP27DRAFT_1403630 [Rhodocollybia butyracea]
MVPSSLGGTALVTVSLSPDASKKQGVVIWIQEAARGISDCSSPGSAEPVDLEIHHVYLLYCASREQLQEGYNPNLLETGKKQMDADLESSNGKEGYPANCDFGQLSSSRRTAPRFRTTRGIRPHISTSTSTSNSTSSQVTDPQNVQCATSTNISSSTTSTALQQSVQLASRPQPRRRETS